MNPSTILPHYLLSVNAAELILANGQGDPRVPSWVSGELWATSSVVVGRGQVTQDSIPVGIRGTDRSQRWAASCPPHAIRKIVTPSDLLKRFEKNERSRASPVYRGLRLLAFDWQWLAQSWGPGGSVGFELATGKETTTPRSDLDIVIYANERLSRSDSWRLVLSARSLPVAVDIRVETPVCGFSLAEYARSSGQPILLRTAGGPVFGDNPWNEDLGSMAVPREG